MNILNVLLMAPSGGASGGGSPIMTFLPLILIAVVFYFFMIRPQSKRVKEQKKFIEELKKGDKIVTIGGMFGSIVETHPDYFLIEIDHNVRVRIQRAAVSMENSKSSSKPPAA